MKTVCHQLYKGKGEKKDFGNQRFIHTKEDIPKAFEQIVINKAKPKIVQHCTKFQIGSIPGHQPAEHLFVMKSIIALYEEQDKMLILQCYDIKKYFDSENLRDAMNSLYNYGVRGKIYNLIYELNRSSQIQIKTGVGFTKSVDIGPSVAQGSIGGGLVSSCNLDYSVNRFFQDSEKEIYYRDIKLQPLIYQDDLARFSNSIREANDGNVKIEAVMEGKLLDLHKDKSCFLVFGNTKQKENFSTECSETPIKLYNERMKEKVREKYLGDMIDSGGNAASVAETVKDRYGKILNGIFEIRQVVEDSRCLMVGGAKAGIELWETSHIPSLLNNCQTWLDVSEETVQKLEELQNKFYRILLSVPRTTPKPALIWEMGGVQMKWRIIQQKLIFLNHIHHLDPQSLAYQVQQVQERDNLPGLTKECKSFMLDLGLPNCLVEEFPQVKWKKLVKKAILETNESEIREAMKSKKKLKDRKISQDNYGMKTYVSKLSIHETRNIFKHRSSMTQNVKLNYKGVKRYEQQGWKCDACDNLDSEDHLLWCVGYTDLRESLNLEIDKDLSEYLQKIKTKRMKK